MLKERMDGAMRQNSGGLLPAYPVFMKNIVHADREKSLEKVGALVFSKWSSDDE